MSNDKLKARRSSFTGKKIQAPPTKKSTNMPTDVTVVPTLNSLMNDALAIIGAELAQYRMKTQRGITLDLKEARVIANYMDTLTRASKESREQARAEDLADLSDSELLQLATQLAQSQQTPKLDKAAKADEDGKDEN